MASSAVKANAVEVAPSYSKRYQINILLLLAASQAIAYLQSDDSQVDLCYFVDFVPFSPRVIQQRYARAGRANPRVRVGLVELGREGTTWIPINDRPYEYIVRVKWLPDGKRISLEAMTRAQTELSLYLADRNTGAASFSIPAGDPHRMA